MRWTLFLLTAFMLSTVSSVSTAQAAHPAPAPGAAPVANADSPESATLAPPPPPPIETPAPTPPTEAPSAQKHVLFNAGLGYRTTSWSHFENPSNSNVDYNVKTATNTIVEGDLAIPKTNFRIGFAATPDGGVGKASNYLGYLGFKGFSLKTETGSFSGAAHFSGQVATGESRDINFAQVYHYTELDYTFILGEGLPWFVGLRYTKWDLPAEIALLAANQSSGPTILDQGFHSSFYSLVSGFDFFKDPILIGGEKASTGWGVMGSFLVGIGLGSAQVSDTTAAYVQNIYSKSLSTQSLDVFTLHLSAQLGPKYTFNWKGVSGAIGIGYDINLLDLIADQSGGGSSTPATQVDPVAYPNFIYQGWILRTMATF